MKKIYSFIILILLSLVLNHFFYSDNIIDVVTGAQYNGALLQWPVFRIFIEPFYAFAYYILTMERSGYVFALCSWIFWAIILVVILSKYYKISRRKTVVYSFAIMFFIVSIICMIVILPVPGPKLIISDDYKIVDIHSHSISSKDNLSKVSSNINFHNKHGYTDFFITEHDTTNGYDSIPGDIKTDNIFPGIQIRTKEGISVLLLSQKQFKYYDFKGKSIQDMIDTAHSRNMLVIAPHVWKWKDCSVSELVEKGVDGFEIYNCGYRFLKQDKRNEIINACNKNNLMMFGTTDWHGLGYMANVWTLVQNDNSKNLFEILKDNRPKNIVVVHDTKGWQSIIRYVFEPFFAFYYYITNTKIEYILSFYMIMSLFLLLFFKFKVKNVVRYASLMFALFFLISLFYFANLISFNFTYNVIIPETIIPTALSLILVWTIIWGLCEKYI